MRVTLIDAAGRVRGDSEVTLAGLGEVEVHNARAEVVAARAHGQGTARRRSATLATDMLYVAVRAPVGDTVYVTRAATPLVEVAQSVRALRVALAVAGAAALFVALALGALASQMMSGRLRALVQRTQRVRGVEVGPVEDDDETLPIGILSTTDLVHAIAEAVRHPATTAGSAASPEPPADPATTRGSSA